MILFVFEIIGVLLGSLLLTYVMGFLNKTLKYVKTRRKEEFDKLLDKKLVKHIIRDTRYPFIYEVLKWHLIDIYRDRDFFDLFGIWCFTGFYGEGKTMGAVQYALKLKAKYPQIKIFTNFNLKSQDGRIEKWEDLLNLPGWSIVIFDEIQSTFTSTRYAEFPIELLWKLTQCRKSNLAIFASSPVYSRMSIQLRESTDYVIECKNMFKRKRWFKYDFYRSADYEKFQDDKDKLKGKKQFTQNVIASDDDYNSYDTRETVTRLDVEEQKPVSKGVSKDYIDKFITLKIEQFAKKNSLVS